MLRIIEAKAISDSELHLAFSDGMEGTLNLKYLIGLGVFAKLKDPNFMKQVFIDPESGTVAWPGGLDLDPIVLYSKISHRPIEESLSHYYA